jgi:hypothetical protein
LVSKGIGFHILFEGEMNFTRKARFVARGHTTTAPSSMTYSRVVSRGSIRLAFLIAALNALDIMWKTFTFMLQAENRFGSKAGGIE